MVRYEVEGVLPAPREVIWRLLDRHQEGQEITRIHRDVVGQRLVEEHPGEYVMERRIRFLGKDRVSNWRVTYHRPDRFRWEVLDGEGPIKPGSFLESTLSEDPAGTFERTEGEVTVVRFPGFMQRRIVARAMADIDSEDQAYLKSQFA